MDALEALLGAEIKDEKEVYIRRLNTNFTIKSISGAELQEATDEASVTFGSGRNRRKETDDLKFSALLIAKACVKPNFADSRLLEKYGAVSVDEVVLKALRAGEVAKLAQEVMEISGFEDDDDAIEDVKN